MNLHIDSMNSGRYSSRVAVNPATGFSSSEFNKRPLALCALFLRHETTHIQIMVGCVGASKDAPGSLVDRSANPAQFTTSCLAAACGDYENNQQEAAIMATTPTTRTPEVLLVEGRVVTSSLAVAAYFVKDHKNVIQKIQSLDCSPKFTELNFQLSEYTDPTGRILPCYEITRDGFAFLAMGFTGKRAAKFKEDYIEAFNRMESCITGTPPSLPEYIRLTVTIKDGVVVDSHPIRKGEIVGSLEDFFELAERQGFLVINLDDLKSLSISKKLRVMQ